MKQIASQIELNETQALALAKLLCIPQELHEVTVLVHYTFHKGLAEPDMVSLIDIEIEEVYTLTGSFLPHSSQCGLGWTARKELFNLDELEAICFENEY